MRVCAVHRAIIMSTGVFGSIVKSGSWFGGNEIQSQRSQFPQDSVGASRLQGSEFVMKKGKLIPVNG